jgi:hypothetical protein
VKGVKNGQVLQTPEERKRRKKDRDKRSYFRCRDRILAKAAVKRRSAMEVGSTSKVWTKKRAISDMDESYLRQLLKNDGIKNPTPEHYQRKRVQVLALRTEKIFKLMTYAGIGK